MLKYNIYLNSNKIILTYLRKEDMNLHYSAKYFVNNIEIHILQMR